MRDCTESFGDRLGSSDGFHDIGESTHEHEITFPPDDPRVCDGGKLLEVSTVGSRQDHVIGPTCSGRGRLIFVTRQHGHRTLWEKTPNSCDCRQADDASAYYENRVSVVRTCAEESVARDRNGLVKARCTIRYAVRQRMKHRTVCHYFFGPAAAETLGETQSPPAADHPAVKVETRRCPTPRTAVTWWVDSPCSTRNARVHRNPGTFLVRALVAGLDHATTDLMAQNEGERPHGNQGR